VIYALAPIISTNLPWLRESEILIARSLRIHIVYSCISTDGGIASKRRLGDPSRSELGNAMVSVVVSE
jgi:hypothetical protein